MIKKLKKIKIREIAYPAIIIAYAILVVTLSWTAFNFLSSRTNRIFALDEDILAPALKRVNIQGFYLVSEKLGIEIKIDEVKDAAEAAADLTE